MDSSRKQICRFDHFVLMLYLALQLSSTDLVLGEQDGGRKLRLLLEKQLEILGFMRMSTLGVCETCNKVLHQGCFCLAKTADTCTY